MIGTLIVELLILKKKCKHLRHGLGRMKVLWLSASDNRTGMTFSQSQIPTDGLETSQEFTKPPLRKVLQGSLPQNVAWTPQDLQSCSQSDCLSSSSPATLHPPHTLPASGLVELHRDQMISTPLHCPFSSSRSAPPTFMDEFQFHTGLSKQWGYYVSILSCTYSYQSIYYIALFAYLSSQVDWEIGQKLWWIHLSISECSTQGVFNQCPRKAELGS